MGLSLSNPGQLKLDLMLKGMRVDPAFFQKKLLLPDVMLAPSVFGNAELELQQNVKVSVPYQEPFAKESPYQLKLIRGHTVLTFEKFSISVKLLPPPFFLSQNKNGFRMEELMTCYGDFVSVWLQGHRFLMPTLVENQLLPKPAWVASAMEEVRSQWDLAVVGLSSWEEGEDGGAFVLEPYVRAIKNSVNALVLIELGIPKTANTIDRTFAMGANSVCYHMKNSGREEDLKLLAHAVSVFQQGAVLAHLDFEPLSIHPLLKTVERLLSLGVIPLVTFSPEKMGDSSKTVQDLALVYSRIYQSIKKERLPIQWLKNLSPFFMPMEGRFLAEGGVANQNSLWGWLKAKL